MKARRDDMQRICFGKNTKVTIVKFNLLPVWVTRERQRAFLMCPAARFPPRSVCHFVRPHKDATRSCVEEQGKSIGCLMDIPEAKASTSECFCFIKRSLKITFVVRVGQSASKLWMPEGREKRKQDKSGCLVDKWKLGICNEAALTFQT